MAETWVHRDVEVDNFNIHYIEAGQGDSVVLLHDGGFGGSGENTWAGVIPVLAESGYRVLAPDMLGFGATDKVVFLDRPPFAAQIQYMARWCDTLDIVDAHIVGNSFGGTVALRAMCDQKPSLPAKTVVSIGGTGGPWRRTEGMAALTGYDGSEESMEKLTDALAASFEGREEYVRRRNADAHRPGHYQAMVAPRAKLPHGASPQTLGDSFPEGLSANDRPILLVAGIDDPTNEHRWWTHLESTSDTISSVVVKGRHSPNIEVPKEVAAILLEWFAKHGTKED